MEHLPAEEEEPLVIACAAGPDDASLKSRCLRGEDEAWRELYRVYFRHAELRATSAPFLLAQEEAKDIAQNTMIELTKNLETIRNIGAFVHEVAKRKCIDWIRKKKEVSISSLEGEDETGSIIESVVAPDPLPSELVENPLLAELKDSLESLGEPCRSLLRCLIYEELSYEDAAVKTRIPAPQVGMHRQRCLAELRELLKARPAVWSELRDWLISLKRADWRGSEIRQWG